MWSLRRLCKNSDLTEGFKNMTIIVTGCAGFIGLNFTKYWLYEHKGDKVVGIDSFSYAANVDEIYELCEKEHNFVFYRADICDKVKISRIFQDEKPNAVVNFAAETHVDRSIESAEKFLMTNVVGTNLLLDACREYGNVRFHQISTDEVYGDLPLNSKKSFTESSPLLPSSPYSASKAAADLLSLAYYRTHGVPVTISRSANNYGFFQHEEKMIPHSVKSLMRGEKISIYGDGKNVRDWIYVGDHVKAVEAILLNGKIGEIYNVGAGYEISNLELARKIILCYTESSDAAIDEYIEFVPDRKGHDRRYSLDTSKIKNALGWQAISDFDEELLKTIKWIGEKQ